MLKPFLDKYDTVIFDMDGVITSEQNYWNCAALTVWEYLRLTLETPVYTDVESCAENVSAIRETVFCSDRLIEVLKSKGVNSNWDLGYVTVLIVWSLYGRHIPEDFSEVLNFSEKLGDNILSEYDNLAKRAEAKTGISALERNGEVWMTMQRIFQSWFLGEEMYKARYNENPPFIRGKKGLMYKEEPIVNMEKLKELLRLLSRDKRLCTGTGRPSVEIIAPLKEWDMLKFFAPDGLCNYDHVETAENNLGMTLTKPHPYMFLKALYGTDYDDIKIIRGEYAGDKIKRALIVGDAGSDILAAQAMGADFCAVLTGVNGEKARPFFESMGAQYILRRVTDMIGR